MMIVRPKSSSPWFRLTPALLITGILFGASLIYGLAQSLGALSGSEQPISLEAYRSVLFGQGTAGREFWSSLGFSLWVAGASTLLSAMGALPVAIWLSGRRGKGQRMDTLAMNWNLAFPHLVWAIALILFFSQSGLLARFAASLGWIQTPADFPVIVRDRLGIGIIIDYVTKEIPFLALILLAVLRSQSENYEVVAENLGATRWQRLRYITLPMVLPALIAGSLLVFAFVFSAYEVPALLGVRYPRMLPVLALDFFVNPDLNSRNEGMAISFIIAAIVMVVAAISLRQENRQEKR
jgi:putative spermidine/putrescine transport system permease protein